MTVAPAKLRNGFRTPAKSIGALAPEIAGQLLSMVADLALIVDEDGIIRDLAFGSAELGSELDCAWLNRRWIDTVTVESRTKVEDLLRDAAAQVAPRWRHINHPTGSGADLPILYSAIRMGEEGHIAVLGRDLRDIADLQQRLMKAQESLEQDHARARSAETRYRMLFQLASEAVLIVETDSNAVVEANPAAGRLLGADAKNLLGKPLERSFDKRSQSALIGELAAVRAGKRGQEIEARSADGKQTIRISASAFRQDHKPMLLVRLIPQHVSNVTEIVAREKSRVLALIDESPDGFVVTDPSGVILTANSAFLELIELASVDQARGQSIDRWLGRPGVDLSVMLANLRRRGTIRLFATTVKGEYGTTAEVEISGVCTVSSDRQCLGLTVRPVGQRLARGPIVTQSLPQSLDRLTELVGRVTLKELVREATDVIERMCIEAALNLTNDNRASAAEMLGLSRQSLYVKMRRYGLGDLNGNSE